VSHDRAFLDNAVTSTLVFEGEARVNEYVGGYTDWLRQRSVSGAGTDSGKVLASVPSPLPAAASVATVQKARRLSYKDQRELAALPEKINRLEAEQLQLQTAIADPKMFHENKERAAAALQRLESLAAELESAYSRWDALES
jgi:ATP-binding cassette subfamily F protein uup